MFCSCNIDKDISQSWSDIKREITLPDITSLDLAEETGIHIGDGNLYVYTDKHSHSSYRYCISGNLTDEVVYHELHILPLLKKLYNIDAKCKKRMGKNSIDTVMKSKTIVEFKTKKLNLPIGKKNPIFIPKHIEKDNELAKRCLIGIFDTDFTINDDLALVGNLSCKQLLIQINKILNTSKIRNTFKWCNSYGRIRILKEDTAKIVKEWRLNNIKHTSKFDLVKEYKKHIPYSTTAERLAVLQGAIEFEELQGICKKRKRLGSDIQNPPCEKIHLNRRPRG